MKRFTSAILRAVALYVLDLEGWSPARHGAIRRWPCAVRPDPIRAGKYMIVYGRSASAIHQSPISHGGALNRGSPAAAYVALGPCVANSFVYIWCESYVVYSITALRSIGGNQILEIRGLFGG